MPSVDSELLPGTPRIGYLHLYSYQYFSQEMEKALNQLHKEKAQGLILDLRIIRGDLKRC